MQRNMEWKPKTSLKSTTISPAVTMTTPAAALADTSNLSAVDVNGLSNKLSQANISDDRHVIIPEHLRVPESEYACLTFGSFGAGLDPTEGLTSASQAFEKSEQFNEPCSRCLRRFIIPIHYFLLLDIVKIAESYLLFWLLAVYQNQFP